jgi:hypothetical protein
MLNKFKIVRAGFFGGCTLVATMYQSQAVLFYATSDPSYNTTPPTGSLVGSGWQYQGEWGGFSGTAIAPHYFISAQHIGGAVGQVFHWNDLSFTTINYFDDSSSDLRIWQVQEAFSSFAPLYSLGNEVGKSLVVIGRGTQRGAAVVVTGSVHGWQIGPSDRIQRWGQNVVASTISNKQGGDLLTATFDANAGPNEADLSEGDSGGAVYIQDGATWKLAGINYSVDGNYNDSPIGPGFAACLFDYGGLYNGQEGSWSYNLDLPTPQPGSFYATRVSIRKDWINSILATPLPASGVTLQIAATAAGAYSTDLNATVDTAAQVITTTLPAQSTAFFQISGTNAVRITSIKQVGGKLQISFQ